MEKSITKRTLCTLLLYMVIMTILSACQPTPEKTPVIQRDNAEKVIFDSKSSEAPPYTYNVPSKAEESFSISEGNCDAVVDASVDMPSIKEFPVAKCKSVKFDKDTADRIINYFAGGGELVTPRVLTKNDYDEMIIEAKRGQLEDGKYVVNEGSQQNVDELEKEREQAPDKETAAPVSGYDIDGAGLKARIIRNNETVGTVRANESSIAFTSPIPFRLFTEYVYNPATGLDERNDADYKIGMTADKAEGKAENLLSSLGISGFQVKKTTDVYYYSGHNMKDIKFGGYSILFMRGFGGMMPFYTTNFSGNKQDKYEYCPPVRTETIEIDIDEYGGVQGFSWQHPIEIVETITKNVKLLPFDELIQRLEEYAKQHWAWLYDEPKKSASAGNNRETPAPETESPDNTVQKNKKDIIKISGMALELAYIPIKDDSDEFMYAPCWVFKYEESDGSDTADRKEQESVKEGDGPGEYLVLNAVDGGSVSVYPAEVAREIEQGMGSEITVLIHNDWFLND